MPDLITPIVSGATNLATGLATAIPEVFDSFFLVHTEGGTTTISAVGGALLLFIGIRYGGRVIRWVSSFFGGKSV